MLLVDVDTDLLAAERQQLLELDAAPSLEPTSSFLGRLSKHSSPIYMTHSSKVVTENL